ncbi:MAG: ABC transporter permease [Alphaproteobacteria bacterium]|nr:ABC transporter permease [Alphaproteobacteria bacterium]
MFDRVVKLAAWGTVLFLLAPLIVIIGASVTTTPFVAFPPQGFTLKWYQQLLTKPDFIESFLDSLVLGVLATIGAAAVGIPAAIGLHHGGIRARAALRSFVLAPLTLPTIVTGVALLQFYYAIDLDAPLTGLLFGHMLITIPFYIRTVGAALLALDPAILEAAESLGAGPLRTHLKVTLPAVSPSILAATTFVFITSFDQVTISVFLSTPDVMPLPIRIYNYIEFAVDPMVAAVSAVLIALSFAIVAAMQKLLGLNRAFIGSGS